MNERDCTKQDVTNFSKILDYITNLTRNGVNPTHVDMIIRILDEAIDFESYLCHEMEFTEIHRLTINKSILGKNQRIREIAHVKYPPRECVKSYGRCNQPGQSILYASSGMLSILSEMKPELGDLITISTWRNVDNATLTFCPIFKNQPADGIVNINSYNYNKEFNRLLKNMPPNIGVKVDLLTQFVANAFSKLFARNSNDVNYLISAYFSDIMLNRYNNKSIEAIFYPSVQQNLAFENLAIKPSVFDDKYRLVHVKDAIIVNTPAQSGGGYFQEGIGDSSVFKDNTIVWDDRFYQPNDSILRYIKAGYEF